MLSLLLLGELNPEQRHIKISSLFEHQVTAANFLFSHNIVAKFILLSKCRSSPQKASSTVPNNLNTGSINQQKQ